MVRLQHENQLLKMQSTSDENSQLLQSMLDDANAHKHELECQVRSVLYSCLLRLFRASPVISVSKTTIHSAIVLSHFYVQQQLLLYRVLAIAILSVHLSVCPSVTRVDQSKRCKL